MLRDARPNRPPVGPCRAPSRGEGRARFPANASESPRGPSRRARARVTTLCCLDSLAGFIYRHGAPLKLRVLRGARALGSRPQTPPTDSRQASGWHSPPPAAGPTLERAARSLSLSLRVGPGRLPATGRGLPGKVPVTCSTAVRGCCLAWHFSERQGAYPPVVVRPSCPSTLLVAAGGGHARSARAAGLPRFDFPVFGPLSTSTSVPLLLLWLCGRPTKGACAVVGGVSENRLGPGWSRDSGAVPEGERQRLCLHSYSAAAAAAARRG